MGREVLDKKALCDTVEFDETEYGVSYHLVADKDATIYSIVTRAGNAVVKNGQSVKKGDVLVLGQNEIFDDSGVVKETLYFKAEAQIWADVVYDIEIPLSELQIASMRIAGKYDDKMLLSLGYCKLHTLIENLEKQEVIILDTEGMLIKTEKNISFRARIYAREQIGINIPAEELLEK